MIAYRFLTPGATYMIHVSTIDKDGFSTTVYEVQKKGLPESIKQIQKTWIAVSTSAGI